MQPPQQALTHLGAIFKQTGVGITKQALLCPTKQLSVNNNNNKTHAHRWSQRSYSWVTLWPSHSGTCIQNADCTKPHFSVFTLLLGNTKPCLGNIGSHFTKRIQKDIPSWGLEDHVSPSLLLFLLAFHCKLELDHPFWLTWGCFHYFQSLPSCQFIMVGAKKGTWKLNQVYILFPLQVHRAMRQCLFHYPGH